MSRGFCSKASMRTRSISARNYSGDQQEPMSCPPPAESAANGAQGIAVGMATSIPPHNLAELCDASLYLIAHNNCDGGSIAGFRARAGFSDSGILVEPKEAIAEAYRTGEARSA